MRLRIFHQQGDRTVAAAALVTQRSRGIVVDACLLEESQRAALVEVGLVLAVGFVIVPRPHTESGHRHDAHAHPDDRATQRGGARYARRLETRGGRGAEGGHHHAGALRHVQATGHVVALGKRVVSGEAVHHGAHHAGDF